MSAAPFDAVLRKLLTHEINELGHDERVARVLNEIGFGPVIMHDIAMKLSETSALDLERTNRQMLVAETHSDTYFTTEGIGNAVSTVLGSKPGDPLGDVIYNFIAA